MEMNKDVIKKEIKDFISNSNYEYISIFLTQRDVCIEILKDLNKDTNKIKLKPLANKILGNKSTSKIRKMIETENNQHKKNCTHKNLKITDISSIRTNKNIDNKDLIKNENETICFEAICPECILKEKFFFKQGRLIPYPNSNMSYEIKFMKEFINNNKIYNEAKAPYLSMSTELEKIYKENNILYDEIIQSKQSNIGNLKTHLNNIITGNFVVDTKNKIITINEIPFLFKEIEDNCSFIKTKVLYMIKTNVDKYLEREKETIDSINSMHLKTKETIILNLVSAEEPIDESYAVKALKGESTPLNINNNIYVGSLKHMEHKEISMYLNILVKRNILNCTLKDGVRFLSLSNKGINVNHYNRRNILLQKIKDITLFDELVDMHYIEIVDLFERFDISLLRDNNKFKKLLEFFKRDYYQLNDTIPLYIELLSKCPSHFKSILELNALLEDGDVSKSISEIITKIELIEDELFE